jgi:hypothetical protein
MFGLALSEFESTIYNTTDEINGTEYTREQSKMNNPEKLTT